MSKKLQARTKADSSTTAAQLSSANLAQNPMLAVVTADRITPENIKRIAENEVFIVV